MATDRILSSSNHIVCELFQALRRLCMRVAESHAEQDESTLRQDTALCVILAVQCVEVFFNVYFRLLVSEPDYAHAAEKISAELASPRCGLDRKIRDWPFFVLGKHFSLGEGVGQRLVILKNLRNELMHFTSSHETFSIPGITIHGMVDTSVYHALSAKTAIEALHTAEAFLCEVFSMRGISPEQLPHVLHSWTGRPPV